MLGRLLERVVKDPGWGRWAAGGDAPGAPGARVNSHSATQLLAVYGCVTLVADVIATMPVDQFRKAPDGSRIEVPPASWVEQPNSATPYWDDFVRQCVWQLLLGGNLFLLPMRGDSGRVVEVWVADGAAAEVRSDGGRRRLWLDGRPYPGEVVHVPLYRAASTDLMGCSPIEHARQALGYGLNLQAYASNFIAKAAVPPVVIEAPGDLTREQLTAMRDGFAALYGGPSKAGLPGVLMGGATAKQLTVTPEQAQFLESRRFSAAEIASCIFHVPPDYVGVAIDGSTITYQNLETRWIELVRRSCMPLMRRLERAFYWLVPRPQYIRLNADVWLRPDTLSRYQAHSLALDPVKGWLTRDEVRAIEDLPPLPTPPSMEVQP